MQTSSPSKLNLDESFFNKPLVYISELETHPGKNTPIAAKYFIKAPSLLSKVDDFDFDSQKSLKKKTH